MKRLLELPVALALKRILGRPPPAQVAPRRAPSASPARAEGPGPPRGALALGTLGAGALGFLLLVLVDARFVRVLAVLLLFAFIVAGVFAIASPALLDDDEEVG